VISAYLCWPARVFSVLRVRQWVRSCTRHSLRPLFSKGDVRKTRTRSRRGKVGWCPPLSSRTSERMRARSGIHNHGDVVARSQNPEFSRHHVLWLWVLAFARTTVVSAERQGLRQERSSLLTIFCHCRASAFSSRTTPQRGRQPSVNRFGREFPRRPRVWHVDSQRYQGSSGRGRSLACDFRCDRAHPASRAPASYLPLRADWALAPGHSGVA
jgi:hypothetical protein